MKDVNEQRIIKWWPVAFPLIALLYLYLGIGSFLSKQLDRLLDWSVKL